MRILVADQNALLLAAIASTFGRHCEVVVATRRDECVAHIEERKFDVVVACERLRDYTGLELLGEVTALSPQTLRIFSARPETLKHLGPRLDFFGLLGTLSYPIDPRKLLLALKVARGKLAAVPGRPMGQPGRPMGQPKPPKPKVRHVVLEESEWDTGERLGLLERELEAAASVGGGPGAHGDSAAEHADGDASGAKAGSVALATSNPAGAAGRLGADASDVRVVDSAAWAERPSQAAVDDSGNARTRLIAAPASGVGVAKGRIDNVGAKAPHGLEDSGARKAERSPRLGGDAADPSAGSPARKASTRTTAPASPRAGEASFDVSFDEMPGAIAVARRAPKPTASQSPSVGVARADKPRAAVNAAIEKTPRRDVKAELAPRGALPAGGELQPFGKEACNDPDIDAPLPAETYGAANEPLYDSEPGKGGVRVPSGSRRPATSEASAHQPSEASRARDARDASGARATSAAHATRDASGAHATSAARGAEDTSGTRGASGSRGKEDASRVHGASAVHGMEGASGARAASGGRGTRDNESDRPETEGTSDARRGAAGTRGGAKSANSPGAAKGAKDDAAKGPKVRKPTVPTAAQREAFQRALARRNAARHGGGFDESESAFAVSDETGDHGTPDGARTGGAPHSAARSTPFISTESLSDLARMATKKRPLKEFNRGKPKRRVLVYGSGVVAALLAVVSFQLLKATPGDRHVQEANAHLFGPRSTLAADGAAPPAQVFTPTPPQAAAPIPAAQMASSLPQPQKFDPNTAPPDPPPPPAVEHPGPVEPGAE